MAKPMYKRMSNAKQLAVILLVIFLAMAGAYYYFFSNLRAMGETASALDNETNSLLSQDENLTSLQAVFSATTNDREKVNSYFIQKDGAIDFVTTIENLAVFSKLDEETQSISTTDENPPSSSHELLHLTLRTTGSWQNTFYFISLLESLPFKVKINQINLHSTGETTTSTEALNPSADLSPTATSSEVKTVTKKQSVWEASYDFSILKLK